MSNDWTENFFDSIIEVMLPTLFSLGPIDFSPLTLLIPLAFILASYALWHYLKEDYPEEEIISLTIYLALVFLVGARFIHILFHFNSFQFSILKWLLIGHHPGFSFIGGFLACLGLLIIWSKRKNWDFWQVVEVVIPAWFLVAGLVGIGLFLTSGEIIFLGEALLAIILLPFNRFLRKKYRTFVWYKSGKLGFVSCLSVSLFMLGKLFLEIIYRGRVYWDCLFLVVIAVACLALIYQRSEREFREDLRKIFPKRKEKKS